MRGEMVDDRAAGISEREHPRDFVVRFAGGVVARAADARIRKMHGAPFDDSSFTW